MVLQIVSFLALFVILMVILYLWVSFSKTLFAKAAKTSPVPSPAALTMLPIGFTPARSPFTPSPAPLRFQ